MRPTRHPWRWWRDRIAYLRLQYSLPLLALAGVAALLLVAAATRLVFDFARSMDRPSVAAFDQVPVLRRSLEQVTVSAINTVTQFSSAASEPILTVQLVVDPEQLSLFQTRQARRGRMVLPGSMWWNGEWVNTDVSLRGENVFHWGADLKSYKVRLKGRDTGGQDVFNLVNPKDAAGFDLLYGEETGRRLGLLTPGSVPCRFMLNSKNQGLYACQQNINEAWVLDRGRVAGNLYSGDILFMGFDSNAELATQLWDRSDLWQQEMVVPGIGETQSDLRVFLRAVSDVVAAPAGADPLRLYERLAASADVDAFLRLWVTQTWAKSIHQDEFHNWRLYFDPGKGVLEPLVWDTLRDEGTSSLESLNAPLPRPQLAMLRFPELNQRRYEILYRELVAPELQHRTAEKWALQFYAATRHTHLSAANIDQIDYVPDVMMWRPASRLAVVAERERGVAFIREHAANLAAALRAVELEQPVCVPRPAPSAGLACAFGLKSHAALTLVGMVADDRSLGMNRASGTLVGDAPALLSAARKDGRWEFAPGPPAGGSAQFYPVLDVVGDSRAPGRVKAKIKPVRQSFGLHVPPPGRDGLRLVFLNQVTGQRKIVHFAMAAALPAGPPAGYSFAVMPAQSRAEIRLGPGVVTLRESVTGKPGQPVRIVAGTTLRMGRGVSIVAHGPLWVDGTRKAPVRILPLKAGEPWGGILVLGAAATGTALRHCEITGGTTARHANVTAAGMLSFYHLDALTLEHCRLAGDPAGDDGVHIQHVARVTLADVAVTAAPADCIDFDYAAGTLERVSTKGCRNEGLDFMASKMLVRATQVSDSGDKGVSVGENSMVMFTDVIFEGNTIGVLAKDASVALLGPGVRFAANQLDVSAFQKSKHAGHGGCILAEVEEGKLNVSLQDDSRFTGGFDMQAVAATWATADPRNQGGLCWKH